MDPYLSARSNMQLRISSSFLTMDPSQRGSLSVAISSSFLTMDPFSRTLLLCTPSPGARMCLHSEVLLQVACLISHLWGRSAAPTATLSLEPCSKCAAAFKNRRAQSQKRVFQQVFAESTHAARGSTTQEYTHRNDTVSRARHDTRMHARCRNKQLRPTAYYPYRGH